MPNRLAGETSPYLLQHAQNPVDWYPWGAEGLSRARSEDRLIFLSIGYAACHWCHVMEHECFEDEAVAAILNRGFVSIKVDREERPDIDEIYMAATMLFSGGHGGWPMSVFLAPDLRPVFAGTYFPKHGVYGRPGFLTVLQFLGQKWSEERDALTDSAGKVTAQLGKLLQEGSQAGPVPGPEHAGQAAAQVYRAFDHTRGGIASQSNKFPQSMSLDLLLRAYQSTGEARYRDVVELTLERISLGGIYDHLGGGLHRYATDPDWLVPHFEKMLYDQALVASTLVDAWQASDEPAKKALFADRARGICDYVLRDLRAPEGAFYSSEDADSEGKEGKFYVWTKQEIDAALAPSDARLFASHYDVTEHGNWMHPGDAHVPSGPKNVLQVVRPAETLARLDGTSTDAVNASLARSRQTLLAIRSRRPRPGLDDKVLTGWNGLMIGALAKVAAALGAPRYGQAATDAADFVLRNLRVDGRLMATYGKGSARLSGYSTDYAFMAWGLVRLYEWAADPRHLLEAERLTDTLVRYFWDGAAGGFYLTASDHEELLVRSKTAHDGATPSANSVMAIVLQQLAVLLDRADYRRKAGVILELFADRSLRQVFQQELLCCAVDAWHRGWDELAIVGPSADPRTVALLEKARSSYRPNMVLAQAQGLNVPGNDRIPLLAGKDLVGGEPAAHLCREYRCERPVTSPDQLFA